MVIQLVDTDYPIVTGGGLSGISFLSEETGKSYKKFSIYNNKSIKKKAKIYKTGNDKIWQTDYNIEIHRKTSYVSVN